MFKPVLTEEEMMSEGSQSKPNPLSPNDSSIESETRMDLGDDLLQTRTLLRAPAREPMREEPSEVGRPTERKSHSSFALDEPVDSVDELLVNAKILMGEGLIDDAKATLRKVMKLDPGNLTARDRLAEIQSIEIKRLLGGEEAERPSFLKTRKKTEEKTPEELLLTLEKEIGPGKDPESELFGDEAGIQRFLKSVERASERASPQDRIDLGIGFLEMGLYEAAVRQFREASKDLELGKKARGLLAFALLERGDAFDAMIELEALIADQEASAEEKIDFGYMAGLAQEKLGHYADAARWYRAVTGIETGYRDAQSRLFRCLKECEKSRSSSSSRS
jgi:tetratricopeptide (TPR) repeat protein